LDLDVVYTPFLSSYGSCTATLQHWPGTAASIFITLLVRPRVSVDRSGA
jgi:hypothetical protein